MSYRKKKMNLANVLIGNNVFLTIVIFNISILTLYRYSKNVMRENATIKRVLIYEKVLGLILQFLTAW